MSKNATSIKLILSVSFCFRFFRLFFRSLFAYFRFFLHGFCFRLFRFFRVFFHEFLQLIFTFLGTWKKIAKNNEASTRTQKAKKENKAKRAQ